MKRGLAFAAAGVAAFVLAAGAAVGASKQDNSPTGVAGQALSTPLHDTNVVKTRIPQVLLDAMAEPYASPRPGTCGEIAKLVEGLDAALGADIDKVPAKDNEDIVKRGSLISSVAGAAEPFRGWVRLLSGAEQHDRLVQTAVFSGGVRRGYLKGLGKERGCSPPAAPHG